MSSPSNIKISTVPISQSFWQKSANCFTAGVLCSLLAYRCSKVVVENNLDFCPSMPESIYHYASNVCHLRENLPSFSGALEQEALMIPFVEEVLFRYGLQEILFKQLPKATIKQIDPSMLSSVDSKAAKIARVLITATAFSLAHSIHPGYDWPNCSLERLIRTFAFGIIMGAIQETRGSTSLAIAFHAGFNVTGAYLREVLSMRMTCLPAIPTQA